MLRNLTHKPIISCLVARSKYYLPHGFMLLEYFSYCFRADNRTQMSYLCWNWINMLSMLFCQPHSLAIIKPDSLLPWLIDLLTLFTPINFIIAIQIIKQTVCKVSQPLLPQAPLQFTPNTTKRKRRKNMPHYEWIDLII